MNKELNELYLNFMRDILDISRSSSSLADRAFGMADYMPEHFYRITGHYDFKHDMTILEVKIATLLVTVSDLTKMEKEEDLTP